ncbi:TPA: LysR family transcriptional regulator [Burkholderia cenocepacia]|uniref:LysR family transcriptional regulator n=1 Tax=Burkholderia cenocepacia TaxID=95486 RepID=UPI0009B2376E|nr:LysR family transcriptional regulator [Burkholderia cenocepacia]MCW3686844.1 LysR family transcriptional regulator [Burkholderia cenocepacia]QUN38903.1 LysR family transcriptional regulator [Burkholderia cenocepacia]QUO29194.1 LysR family transcriptional regulator [Burkholderia cenocepacia]
MNEVVDLRLLRYFVTVAEERSVTRAAQRLNMAQPPLSQQIRALETRLGVQLFERQSTGVAMTNAGTALLEHAYRLLDGADALVPHVRQAARGRYRMLKIGVTTSTALHETTSALLRRCLTQHDDLYIELHDDNAQDLIDDLGNGQLDLVMVRVPVLQANNFETLVVDDEPVLLALPSGHPLSKQFSRSAPTLDKLRDEDFILVRRAGQNGIYEQLLAACRAAGFEPRVAAEVTRMLTGLNLVAAGVGVSVVPASMRSVLAGQIDYLPCEQLAPIRAPLTLLHRGRHNSNAAQDAVAVALQYVTEAIDRSYGHGDPTI